MVTRKKTTTPKPRKTTFGATPKPKRPKAEINSVELSNKLKPFRDVATDTIYVVNEVRDESGTLIYAEDVPLNSDQGSQLVIAVIGDMLKETTVNREQFEFALAYLKGMAMRKGKAPTNPIKQPLSQEPPVGLPDDEYGSVRQFVNHLLDLGVTAYVNAEERVCIEFSEDPEPGMISELEIGGARVKAMLFRMYWEQFQLPPSPTVLRDTQEYFRSEAYAWGVGAPDSNQEAAERLMDDNLVIIAVRAYCEDLKKEESRRAGATVCYHELTELAKQYKRSMKDWPERPSDLSRALGSMRNMLDTLGLTFEVKHGNAGKTWTFTRTRDRDQSEPSVYAAPKEGGDGKTEDGVTPKNGQEKDLQQNDASDDIHKIVDESFEQLAK